ncbi:MAG: hypothetical protein ACFE9R_19350 [Candidatus Hermodarchaeota archaeon]
MVLQQLADNPTRIVVIYIAQGAVFAVFLYLGLKVLSRDRKRLNKVFGGAYLSPAVGLFINFLYGPLNNETIVLFLNFLTNFCVFYAPIFLVIFELILLKSEKVITPTKQLLILVGYGIALFCMFFFLFIENFGVKINAETNWSPIWYLPFFIYLVIVESIAVIPSFLLAFQIYAKFEDPLLKKKWRSFIYGFLFLVIFMYGIFVSNFLANSTFRLIMGIISIILAISGAYLMYKSVGQQLEK